MKSAYRSSSIRLCTIVLTLGAGLRCRWSSSQMNAEKLVGPSFGCHHNHLHGHGPYPDRRRRTIVALNYALILEDAGYEILGPVGSIIKGIEIINRERFDGAVLDIDLRGVPVDPIIMALQKNGVPYIFVSAFPATFGPYQNAVFLENRARPQS